MEKTVKEWLDTLPKELRECITKIYHPRRKASKLSLVIGSGFIWTECKNFNGWEEATEFWNGMFVTLREMEQLDRNDYDKQKPIKTR